MEFKLFAGDEAEGLKLQEEAFITPPLRDHSEILGHIKREVGYLYGYSIVAYPIHSVGVYGRCVNHVTQKLSERADFRFRIKKWVPECTQPGDTVVICYEFFECVNDPRLFLQELADLNEGTQFLLAVTPAIENPDQHDPMHLWAWTDSTFADMVRKVGWCVQKDYVVGPHRIILASRNQRTPEEIFNLQNKVKSALESINGSASGRESGARFLTLLEIGGSEVVEFFTKGHVCFAQVDDPEMAIAAARRHPDLNISTKPFLIEADIIIKDGKVHVREALIPEGQKPKDEQAATEGSPVPLPDTP